MVDRVLAVVGNRPVLASQVDEEMFSRQAQGMTLPEDPKQLDALRREVVSTIVDEELLVQQAVRDTSIEVTDQEVADGVEQQVRKVRENFTSEVDYKAELRKAGFQTPEEYRRWLTDQQRRAALQNRLIDGLRSAGKLKTVSPTEQEMKKYFEQHKASLGSRPATISFRQIVISPKPSAAAKVRAKAQADSIVLELRQGADFATAARRFSQDPGSKDQGGSLNWFRRGVMVPEFERVAFSLKPGVVSDPVESPFGYHIIQVERTQPAEVQARHILLVPALDSANMDSARTLAARVHGLILKGAPFDSLQRIHHDPSGGEREADNVPADKLPEAYSKGIAEAGLRRRRAGVHAQGCGRARSVRRAAGHRAPVAGRDPLRGCQRPDPAAARPGAGHSPLSRSAAKDDLRGDQNLSGAVGRAAGQRGGGGDAAPHCCDPR